MAQATIKGIRVTQRVANTYVVGVGLIKYSDPLYAEFQSPTTRFDTQQVRGAITQYFRPGIVGSDLSMIMPVGPVLVPAGTQYYVSFDNSITANQVVHWYNAGAVVEAPGVARYQIEFIAPDGTIVGGPYYNPVGGAGSNTIFFKEWYAPFPDKIPQKIITTANHSLFVTSKGRK